MEIKFLVNDYFTDGEMCALLTALDVMAEETWLSDEQYKLVESARDKLLKAVEE